MLLTGSGAVVFAWLIYRWQSLWFPIFLHVCMNLWWEVFSAAKTALGGWVPFVLQTGSISLAALGMKLCGASCKSADPDGPSPPN